MALSLARTRTRDSRPARTPVRRTTPAVQSLEGRALLTGLLIDVQPRSVSLVGTDSGDKIQFTFTPGLRARTGEVLTGTLRVVAVGGVGSIDRTVNVTDVAGFTLRVDGGAGGDLVRNDTPLRMIALGGSGLDSLVGGSGNDALFGGDDQDFIDGGDGNDVLQGGQERDTLRGGAGDDAIGVVAPPADVPAGWASTDEPDADRFEGGAGNDTLAGGTGTDLYIFDADTPLGDDTLIDAYGPQNEMTEQVSTLDFSPTTTVGLRMLMGLPLRQQVTPTLALTMTGNFPVVCGTQQADRIAQVGASRAMIDGRGGDDLIVGGVGNDILNGGSGNDTVYGGEGGDAIYGGDGNDLIYGQGGTDRLHGEAGNDALYGGDDSDYMNGGTGYDVLVGSKKSDTMDAGGDVFDLVIDTDVVKTDDKDANDWSVLFNMG